MLPNFGAEYVKVLHQSTLVSGGWRVLKALLRLWRVLKATLLSDPHRHSPNESCYRTVPTSESSGGVRENSLHLGIQEPWLGLRTGLILLLEHKEIALLIDYGLNINKINMKDVIFKVLCFRV